MFTSNNWREYIQKPAYKQLVNNVNENYCKVPMEDKFWGKLWNEYEKLTTDKEYGWTD